MKQTHQSSPENDEFMNISWYIEEKEFDNFKTTGECKSDEIEIADGKYKDFKWNWMLKSIGNKVELKLSLKSLPERIGAIKTNLNISCDELLYIEKHQGILLTIRDQRRDALRVDMDEKFKTETNLLVTFDANKFEKEALKYLTFKCDIEILVNYDLHGGVFSDMDKPIFIEKSEFNHLLVFGFLNEIHDFDSNTITASPLSIYELIYKYYLGLITIMGKEGVFIWNFDNKTDVKLFKNCAKGDVITSVKFQVDGCVFYFELTPNGWGLWEEGEGLVWVAVDSLPRNVHAVEVVYKLECEAIQYSEVKNEKLMSAKDGAYSTGPRIGIDTNKFKDLKTWHFKMHLKLSTMWDRQRNQITVVENHEK